MSGDAVKEHCEKRDNKQGWSRDSVGEGVTGRRPERNGNAAAGRLSHLRSRLSPTGMGWGQRGP